MVIAILLIVVGCNAITSTGGGGGTAQPTTTTRPPTSSGASAVSPAPRPPEFEGTVRVTDGISFRSGQPEQDGGSSSTIAYVDYQDRLSGGGAAGSRTVAPWTGPKPTVEQCRDALARNAYSNSEQNYLPKQPGTAFCFQHGDTTIVYAKITDYEPKTSVTIDATVWRYITE